MKKAIIITSCIELSNDYPLTYSSVRTHFSNEDRYRHTIMTIANLDMAADSDTHLFLVDASENYLTYAANLSYQKNLTYVSIKEKMPDIYNDVITHPNKSYCEQLLLYTFITTFKEQLSNYDILIKATGRYFSDSSFDLSIFDRDIKPGFYFKNPLGFEWNPNWGYGIVDLRHIQGNNLLYQYCTVLYGWHKSYTDNFLDISKVIIEFCNSEQGRGYDVETLLYFFTRQFEDCITHMPWVIYGWDGTSGRFLRY